MLINDFEKSEYQYRIVPPNRSDAKSVLCLPILLRDQLQGVLYLENRLTTNAFTQSRLDTTELLLAQAAIAMENAALFSEVTKLNRDLEAKVMERTQELAAANEELYAANQELSAFSHSVSHDLRAPVRTMKGFANILLEDHEFELDDQARHLIERIIKGSDKLTQIIDGLLALSRVQRNELKKEHLNLSELVTRTLHDLQEQDPDRHVSTQVCPDCAVYADQRMMRSAIENLLNNAWKYTGKVQHARIEFGLADEHEDGEQVFFIRDNGAGFNMTQSEKLFESFKRLHPESQFEGTGIGLSTVKRIVERHGGKIWAIGQENAGATFYFTIPNID